MWVNGSVVYSTDSTDPRCGLASYAEIMVDISAFLGSLVTIQFRGECDSSNATDLFLDDVSIDYLP